MPTYEIRDRWLDGEEWNNTFLTDGARDDLRRLLREGVELRDGDGVVGSVRLDGDILTLLADGPLADGVALALTVTAFAGTLPYKTAVAGISEAHYILAEGESGAVVKED